MEGLEILGLNRHKRALMSKIFILVTLFRLNSCLNLICNGDFENYNTDPNNYQYFPNDLCWYNLDQSGYFEVKKDLSKGISNCLELAAGGNTSFVCQNVTLIPNEYYNLTFQFATNDQNIVASIVQTYINQKLVHIASSFVDETFRTTNHKFKANQSHNAICFFSKEIWKTTPIYYISTVLDNFSLVQINKLNIVIHLQALHKAKSSFVTLKSRTNLQTQLIEHIKLTYNLSVNGKNNLVSIAYKNSQNQLCFDIFVDQSFSLSSIDVTAQNETIYDNNFYSFVFTVDISVVRSDAISQIGEAGSKIFSGIWRASQYARALASSKYLLGYISFLNILSVYNFLNLEAQPDFSYYIISNFVNSTLNSDSIMQIAYRLLFGSELELNFLSEESQRQKIVQFKGQFFWLGSYGITSSFLANNYDMIFLLTLLLLKFICYYCFCLCYSCIKKHNPFSGRKCVQLFCIQIACGSFKLLFSSFSIFQASGCSGQGQKLQFLMHIAGVLICFMAFFLYFLLLHDEHRDYYDDKSKKTTRPSFLRQHTEDMFRLFIFNFLPLLLTFAHRSLFLATMSVFIVAEVVVCWLNSKKWSFTSRTEKVTFITVMFMHHGAFSVLYILSISTGSSSLSDLMGTLAILTILFAALSEIIIYLQQIYMELIKPAAKSVAAWLCIKKIQNKKPIKNSGRAVLKKSVHRKVEKDIVIIINKKVVPASKTLPSRRYWGKEKIKKII